MREFLRRLRARPGLAAEIVVASLFANLLALASSLYVIQVLNRYVSYGVSATLATLTVGVLLAIALEYGFRQARLKLAAGLSAPHEERLAAGAFGILTTADLEALEKVPQGERRELLRGLDSIAQAYSASNIGAIIDVPFALLFVVVLFLLSPVLAAVAFVFIVFTFAYAMLAHRGLREPMRQLGEAQGRGQGLVGNASQAADTIRAFRGRALLQEAWSKHLERLQPLRRAIARRQALVQQATQSAQALMSVAVYAVGAYLVVGGNLDVGVLIGANLLSARALGPLVRFAQMGETLTKAEESLARLRQFASLPTEPAEGAKLQAYQGQIEYRDLAFQHGQSPMPLIEGLTLKVAPGGVVVVTGRNGAGKTTLARLTVGLLRPSRGQVLADGVDIRQLAPDWWRRQVAYLPQEPTFVEGTIRDNLLAANPDLAEEEILKAVRDVGLGRFLDESEDGLDMRIANGGMTLAVGQRRRLALARALVTGGRLAVLDEPTEGLDEEGCAYVYSVMIEMAKQGKTIVAFSRDAQILKGATLILDLNSKPVPTIRNVAAKPARREVAGAGE